jgi:hypothetical protein
MGSCPLAKHWTRLCVNHPSKLGREQQNAPTQTRRECHVCNKDSYTMEGWPGVRQKEECE